MADTAGQADIRGINIDKVARGYAYEDLILRKYVRNEKTSSRNIRWYSKTAGFISTPTTTAITTSRIDKGASGALPAIAMPTWTRNTDYPLIFKIESEWMTDEDLMDNDVNLLKAVVKDLALAVQDQVEEDIYDVLFDVSAGVPGDGGNVNTVAATADGWDDTATGNPIIDILKAKAAIRAYRYKVNAKNCFIYMDSVDERNLINYIINVKGSSVPQYASELLKSGVIMGLLNCEVVVSENATTDYVGMALKGVSAAYKEFMQLKSHVIDDPGNGKKIRVKEEGKTILTDPKSVCVITDTQV